MSRALVRPLLGQRGQVFAYPLGARLTDVQPGADRTLAARLAALSYARSASPLTGGLRARTLRSARIGSAFLGATARRPSFAGHNDGQIQVAPIGSSRSQRARESGS